MPWFRTQIVNGNSLIGARRQCYTLQQAQAKGPAAWFNAAPERIEPGQKRSLRKRQIYHFLLGDPGMCAYTDKVIKSLEPEKIKTIRAWNKKFTAPLNDSEADDVLRLCNQIDALWEEHTRLRAEIRERCTDPLSVWGQPQDEVHQPSTIRDKDRIYDSLYLSRGGDNASPYARLKAVMDYWCALWFWPIDQVEELPNRMQFMFDVQMLLGLDVVNVRGNRDNVGQLSFFDDANLDPYAQDLAGRYGKYGAVNLDELRSDFPRLRIANEVAEQQHFFHWELEFADVFEARGGFDLIIGNPPWIKMEWNERAVLGDRQPLFAIKDFSASQTALARTSELTNNETRTLYLVEYASMSGTQAFLSAEENYPYVKGSTNLFKCFLPQSWTFCHNNGISSFVHPDGVFDDPKGGLLRSQIYSRIEKHFKFQNEKVLFDIMHTRSYSLNIYRNNKRSNEFDCIFDLYDPSTIEECYDGDASLPVPGIKDANGDWCTKGHPDRIIHVGRKELRLFAQLFDDSTGWQSARLPVLHCKQLIEVLKCFSEQEQSIGSLGSKVFMTGMMDEAGAQKNGIIKRDLHYAEKPMEMIYSGPHFGLANPFFKSARSVCRLSSDYDVIDLSALPTRYYQRCNYKPAGTPSEYMSHIQSTPWGSKYNSEYRIISRRMLNITGERTLVPSIIMPGAGHIDTVFGIAVTEGISALAGFEASLPYDFFLKATGKSDGRYDTIAKLPYPPESSYTNKVAIRALLLNCLTSDYASLWKNEWISLTSKGYSANRDNWSRKDKRLKNFFSNLDGEWNMDTPLRTDFERRMALVEIDVLAAMTLGMSLRQLVTIYQIQFPVLQKIEADTWYDANGRIVFTVSTNLPGVGFDRKEWESSIKGAPAGKKFYRTITDDTQSGGPMQRTIEYVAPFDKCNRERDYEVAWEYFSKNKV